MHRHLHIPSRTPQTRHYTSQQPTRSDRSERRNRDTRSETDQPSKSAPHRTTRKGRPPQSRPQRPTVPLLQASAGSVVARRQAHNHRHAHNAHLMTHRMQYCFTFCQPTQNMHTSQMRGMCIHRETRNNVHTKACVKCNNIFME